MNAQELAGLLNDHELIEVNDWYFCRHGSEYCSHCPQDQRSMNDDTMDQDLPMDYRKGLSVAGRIVNSGQRKQDGSIIWHCAVHERVDCNDCFNWSKLMRAAGKKKDRGKVENREQLLGLLRSMGAHLPSSTKSTDEALEKKLTFALNYAQNYTAHSDKAPFNPSELPVWKDTRDQAVYNAIQRGSIAEAMKNSQAHAQGSPGDAFPLYQNAFIDLRQTIMHMAKYFDQGRNSVILQDEDKEEVICIRILDVHALDTYTPLVSLLYVASSSTEPLPGPVEKFVVEELRNGGVRQINSTPQEQALMRRLLYLNSTRLSHAYGPELKDFERQFKKSFLLPLGPLSQVHIGKLTTDFGCAVCSNPTTQRCTSCLTVRYCGKACQQAHWPEHKNFCRSIRSGKWVDATFTNAIDGRRVIMFNLHGTLGPDVGTTAEDEWNSSDGAPDNVHADRLFLVKLQRPLDLENNAGIAVYDRGRTVKGCITMTGENAEVWSQAIAQMPYGSAVAKIYRWARRTEDWKLSICIDREPRGENLQW
ncbi:hypothetical protein PENSPDRAFT_654889 [Peniophora sp. CONT]|nr:hypothetical protein PENSPDRAFT_654889 [Peniophora sp. CONT]